MFEVGDVVILRDNLINSTSGLLKLKIGEKYTIQRISYTDDHICDVYLMEYPNVPYYFIRFELCPIYKRKQKILKIKNRCLT